MICRLDFGLGGKEDLVPLLVNLFSGYDRPNLLIAMMGSWHWKSAENRHSHCTLVIHSPHALASLAHGGDEVALGEDFIHKELDVEGDILAVFPVGGILDAASAMMGGSVEEDLDAQ